MKNNFGIYSSYYKISKRTAKISFGILISLGFSYFAFKKYDMIKKFFWVNPFHDTIFSEDVTRLGTDLLEEIIKERKIELVPENETNPAVISFDKWKELYKSYVNIHKDVLPSQILGSIDVLGYSSDLLSGQMNEICCLILTNDEMIEVFKSKYKLNPGSFELLKNNEDLFHLIIDCIKENKNLKRNIINKYFEIKLKQEDDKHKFNHRLVESINKI